jgi:hypothetical protein
MVVKLYVDEAGARSARQVAEPLVVSNLTRVEVASALWRKQRAGELTTADVNVLLTAFDDDWAGSRYAITDVSSAVIEAAARLVGVHGLRAYDAVQLATAIAARAVAPECNELATFDDDLRLAAAAEGFALI